MRAEFNVWVDKSDFGRFIDIAIVQEMPSSQFAAGNWAVAVVKDGGTLEFQSYPEGVRLTPTIRLTNSMAEKLLAGLLELGVKSPSAGAIEGELKATKYHLEDLRRLMKIPKKPE